MKNGSWPATLVAGHEEGGFTIDRPNDVAGWRLAWAYSISKNAVPSPCSASVLLEVPPGNEQVVGLTVPTTRLMESLEIFLRDAETRVDRSCGRWVRPQQPPQSAQCDDVALSFRALTHEASEPVPKARSQFFGAERGYQIGVTNRASEKVWLNVAIAYAAKD